MLQFQYWWILHFIFVGKCDDDSRRKRTLHNLHILVEVDEESTLKASQKSYFSRRNLQSVIAKIAAVIFVASIIWGVTVGNRLVTADNKAMHQKKDPSTVQGFDSSINWAKPNEIAYQSGLSTVVIPNVPSTFEQSVVPQHGIANIFVSPSAGIVKGESSWEHKIQFNTDSFLINGHSYVVPAKYAKQKMFILPIGSGIIWSPVSKLPSFPNQVQQALHGTSEIYYTPYEPNGGSLANGEELIGQLPHRWMGIDGPVVASAWTGWLPKSQVAFADVKSETVYHLELTPSSQLKSVNAVSGSLSGWTSLFQNDLSKPAYYAKPHYYASVYSLTCTSGGFVLEVQFMDATESGRNAGLSSAAYY